MKKLTNIILMGGICLSLLACSQANKQNINDMELSIREIVDKYYKGENIYIGASSRSSYWNKPDSIAERYFKEFSYNTPENSFKQSTVNKRDGLGDDKWRGEEYTYFIDKARETGQVIRAHGPISPQCNRWTREDNRTAQELEGVLLRYMTTLSKELEKNHDVVKWMDVVNEVFTGSKQYGIGYDASLNENTYLYEPDDWFGPRKGNDGWENPWPIMGFEKVTFNGETFEMPCYIRMAFEIANQYAPSIKKIWNSHGREVNMDLFANLKRSLLYIRSLGLKVDGLAWQAHVKLGWEKNPQNIANLQKMITWCHENNLEFHISELDVIVYENHANNTRNQEIGWQKLKETRKEQAETIGAMLEVFLQNRGKGAVGLNFWTMHDHVHGNTAFASLFDDMGNPNESYYKVKELLLKYVPQ